MPTVYDVDIAISLLMVTVLKKISSLFALGMFWYIAAG